MDELFIERIGGVAGFGLPGARIRSRGRCEVSALSANDQAAVEKLFAKGGAQARQRGPDAFRYRITRQTVDGPQTIEAPEHAVPQAIASSVRDEFI